MHSITLNVHAMEFSKSIEFLAILSDSFKLLPRNGKLMAFIALFSTVLYASFVFLVSFTVQSLSRDIAASIQSFMPGSSSFNSTDPSSIEQMALLAHHLRQANAFIFAAKADLVLAVSIISFFSAISTIFLSALSYDSRIMSLKELVSMICTSWKGPLTTSLYISALSIGYFSAIALFCAPLWIYPDLPTTWLGIVIWIPSCIFYLYLAVPLILSVVISAVEDKCVGLEAVGKAAALVKGKRLQGFMINVVFGLVGLIFSQFYRIKLGGDVVLMVVMMVSWMVKILMWVVYTVFYFKCKMQHVEEILELNGSVQYAAVLANDMP